MRVRLTLLDGGDGYTEVYPSEESARARIEEILRAGADDIVSSIQIEPAGKPRTQREILQRYPCLVGHMICESLGYFTPDAAAGALLAYIEGRPFACEWYTHMGGMYKGEWPSDEKLLQVGKDVIERSFRGRHHHRGYMAHYPNAKALVDHVGGGGKGPIFASWL
jgi:hypothetical protein